MATRIFLLVLTFLLGAAGGPAWAGSPHPYLSAGDLARRLREKLPTLVVDLRVREEFAKSHISGAIPAPCYPARPEAQRRQLDPVLPHLVADDAPIVLVCPRGGGGARRARDHLVERGVAAERLFILDKGQEGWNYPELTEGR